MKAIVMADPRTTRVRDLDEGRYADGAPLDERAAYIVVCADGGTGCVAGGTQNAIR